MPKALVLMFVILFSAYGSGVYSTPVAAGSYTGSYTTAGLGTSGGWANGITLNWEVIQLSGGSWQYKYTFSGYGSPSVAYMILELADSCTSPASGCVTSAKNDGANIPAGSLSYGDFTTGMPTGASLHGLKMNAGGTSPEEYLLVSNLAPAWGNFFLHGGTTSAASAYDLGLLPANSGTTDILKLVPVPLYDLGSSVPEPPTAIAFAAGMICIIIKTK